MLYTRENWTIIDLRYHFIIIDQHSIRHSFCRIKRINELNIVWIVLIDRDLTALLRTEIRLALYC